MGDWKGYALDTPSVVLRNWLQRTMGEHFTREHLAEIDLDPNNYPRHFVAGDQPDNPKGHYERKRRWL